MTHVSLISIFDLAFDGLSEGRDKVSPGLTLRETGTIKSLSTGIAIVSGLPGVGFDELIEFPGEVFGIAFNVDEKEIGVVLPGEFSHLIGTIKPEWCRKKLRPSDEYVETAPL